MLQAGVLFCWGAGSCCVCSQGSYVKPTMVAHSKDLLGMRSRREWQSPQSAVHDAKELPEHMADSVLEICLKAHFFSLELHCVDLNGSWSCGQASSPEASHAGWRAAIPSSSSAMPSSAGSRNPALAPKQRLLITFTVGVRLTLCLQWISVHSCSVPQQEQAAFLGFFWVDAVLLIYYVSTQLKIGRSAHLHYWSAADLLIKQSTLQCSGHQRHLSFCTVFTQ